MSRKMLQVFLGLVLMFGASAQCPRKYCYVTDVREFVEI